MSEECSAESDAGSSVSHALFVALREPDPVAAFFAGQGLPALLAQHDALVRASMLDRATIAKALRGHRRDSMSQDSGHHCTCGSDSRFEQRDGDLPWDSMDEHRADVVMRVIAPAAGREARP